MSRNGTAPAPPEPQQLISPGARAAFFLVMTVNQDAASHAAVRAMCADLAPLVRAVGFRDPAENLSCTMSFGSDLWDRLFGSPRPAELHPFAEIRAGARHAVATPGDLLFHIRAGRTDLCFELAQQLMLKLGQAVEPADEVQGFGYFDNRDLLGFVDGTENPTGQEALDATLIGGEDPAFAGGSYVAVQHYIHDLDGWNALPTEAQERFVGRTKLSDVELDDSVRPTYAHNSLNTIVENGQEMKILRAGMPYGSPLKGEYGIYFLAYCRTPRTIEQMLQNMFVGRPPGNYDRLLDFSRPVTGGLFFTPSATLLESLAAAQPAPAQPPAAEPAAETSLSPMPVRDGSLGIGSLKGERRHE
jgi:putative iron-dependent peroxidase